MFSSLLFVFLGFFAPASAPSCHVDVKLVHGERAGAATRVSGKFDAELQEQLEALPVKTTELLSSETKTLALAESGTFELHGKKGELHLLEVTPREKIGRRIQVSVNWKGPLGEALVSTMLHVENGRSVVIGSQNSDPKTSLIMCIRVRCEDG